MTVRMVSRGRTVDRFGWGSGPWDTEDDLYEGAIGRYPASIGRNPIAGFLLGYLGVTKRHPWWDVDYCAITAEPRLSFCGFAPLPSTFANLTKPDGLDVYWLGLDAGTIDDIVPRPDLDVPSSWPREYRTVVWMTDRLEWLTELADAALHADGPSPWGS